MSQEKEINLDEVDGLERTGVNIREKVAPEDEMFHAVYISGQDRINHIQTLEESGKLQIRGVRYNLSKVYGIICHVKETLSLMGKNDRGFDQVQCFSYKDGFPPWKGTTGRRCGANSAERATNPDCKNCKSQLIVSFILCDENGVPEINEEGKPLMGFIMGKGIKYSNVSTYLMECAKIEFPDQIIKSEKNEMGAKNFEKRIVNNKRFVTEISIGLAQSNYGMKKVFDLKRGKSLSKETTIQVLRIANGLIKDFDEKFDQSRRMTSNSSSYVENNNVKSEETSYDPEIIETGNTEEVVDHSDIFKKVKF